MMKKLLPWACAAVIVTVIFATIYTAAQQLLRRDADDPQIQIAQDTAVSLNSGAVPAGLVSGKVNIASSLDAFTIIYSKSGNVVAGSGYLGNSIPVVPVGVLTSSKGSAYNSVTWQPEAGVRLATVEVAANNYYVLSGKSLELVEQRETSMLEISMTGWVISELVLGGTYLVVSKGNKK